MKEILHKKVFIRGMIDYLEKDAFTSEIKGTLYKEAFIRGMIDYLEKDAFTSEMEDCLEKDAVLKWIPKLLKRILSGSRGAKAGAVTWKEALKYGLTNNPKTSIAKFITALAGSYGLGSWGKGELQDQVAKLKKNQGVPYIPLLLAAGGGALAGKYGGALLGKYL